ncbi:MAG: NCS1 family nucleobase:cation symporter-1 [Calditrichia bacterium]|nr:NCS1 family nucleobase:cation symporter-1 [Calditrichia bacterium]
MKIENKNANGMVELTETLPVSHLSNADIAPTPIKDRTWNVWHIAALWVGMSVCIPTYMLAASMISAGMNWWQSLLTILLGNVIVLIPLLLNGHAGTKYGIPFPVYARASFGIHGAHIPSLLRSLVACGWFGIQTWIGGMAIHSIISTLWAGWGQIGGGWQFMGYGLPHYTSFLIFWLINMYFVWAGTNSIKWMETLAAPFLLVTGLLLLFWASVKVGGPGVILAKSDELIQAKGERSLPDFIFKLFIPWLTAMVGFWATLSLNIPDFTRYARSQRDQAIGQGIGLLTTMPLFAFIGIAVTSATLILYGEAIWDPVVLLSRLADDYNSPFLGILVMAVLILATLSTNIAANVVSPANSISNLAPQKITFRRGGLMAGFIGILIMPWKLLGMYLTWLISYSGLLGAVGGVIVCDYLFIRRYQLNLAELYRERGEYAFSNGFNLSAVIATAAGILTALGGKLHPGISFLFDGAWFSAAIVSFGVYYMLMRAFERASPDS